MLLKEICEDHFQSVIAILKSFPEMAKGSLAASRRGIDPGKSIKNSRDLLSYLAEGGGRGLRGTLVASRRGVCFGRSQKNSRDLL